jgi:hypothetical protein
MRATEYFPRGRGRRDLEPDEFGVRGVGEYKDCQ